MGLLMINLLVCRECYIQEQNYHVYEPRGVLFRDPMDRGLCCVSLIMRMGGA